MSSHSYTHDAYQSKAFTLIPDPLDYLISDSDALHLDASYPDPFKSPLCMESEETPDESKLWAQSGIISFTN